MLMCYFDNQKENAISILEKNKNFKKAAKGQQTVLPQMQLCELVQREACEEIPPPREGRPWNMYALLSGRN